MESSWYDRDLTAIAGVQRLRFFPEVIVGGAGSRVFTPAGRDLIDLAASWGAMGVGHGHPAIVAAVTKAIGAPAGASVLSATHPDAILLAEELLALTPGGPDRRVYLGLAGSDANSTIVSAVARQPERNRVLGFRGSYHGGFGSAQDVSGVYHPDGPPHGGIVQVPYPDPRVDPDGGISLAAVAAELQTGTIGAVIVEPIMSDGGMIVPAAGFLAALAQVCAEHDVLLHCDEVKVGLGRTGSLHAFEIDGIAPDIITFGKSLGGGLPLSAAVGPAWLLDDPPASAMLTLAGNPVSVAAGRAVLNVIETEGLAGCADRLGRVLASGLDALVAKHDLAVTARGRGLAQGLQLADGTTAAKACYRAFELGVVIYLVGTAGDVLEFTPPLTISEAELAEALEILDQALTDVAAGVVTDADIAPYAGW